MSLVMVKVYAKTMTYYVLLLSIIFVVGVLGFSSNHSPIYGGLGLIVSGGYGLWDYFKLWGIIFRVNNTFGIWVYYCNDYRGIP